jgi:hypothetical protein
MDAADFVKTKYAKQLIRDAGVLESELARFNARWTQFWDRNTHHLGTVLISHLAVEHYLDEWLAAACPGIRPAGETRLSFSHKVSLLDGADPTIEWLLPGVVRLNRIRNDLAHNIEAEISDKDLEPIQDIVWPWHTAAGKPCNKGVAMIPDFALLVCGMLSSQANAIRRYGDGNGLIAYQRWLAHSLDSKEDEGSDSG